MSDGHDTHEMPPGGAAFFPRLSRSSAPGEAEGALPPGSSIGPFRIEGPLGRGGMGVVYLARDTSLNRLVAVKSLPPEVRHNENIRLRLQREAALLAQLNHPSIPTIYELREIADAIYLIMEYIPGQSLAEYLARGPLRVPEALSLATQIATVLAIVHEHHIVHRDLKPGNIMITPHSQVKVLDFGLARALGRTFPDPQGSPTQPGLALGTVAYMSPELVRGKPADHRTDIWSLGVVLYEMLTGQLPFRGESEADILHSTLYEEPAALRRWREGVPGPLEQVVLKMLQKEPGHRYGSMEQIARALNAFSREGGGRRGAAEESVAIAVLPFADMSPARDQEYFCDGIAEEIINALTRIKGLRVIARTSAFSYKGKNLSVRQIGQELNVDTVLEGSVRWAGDRLRVTAQLIDARRDQHLWSERYDRPKGDIFSIQDEITAAIVDRLKLTLADQEKTRLAQRRPANLEAYHLYLHACFLRSKGTPGALQRAFEYFQQAIARDPNYAPPYVGLALSFGLLPFYSVSAPAQVVPQAKAMVDQALQLDDRLPDALGARSFLKTWYDWDWVGAEQDIRLALELNPGGDWLHLWYAYCLMLQGHYEEARREVCEALALNPNSVLLNRELGMISYFARDYDQAIGTLEKTLEKDASIMYAHVYLGIAYMGKLMYERAVHEFQQEREIARGAHTWADMLEGVARSQMEQPEATQAILDRLVAQSQQVYVSPFHLACVHFALGQNDAGFQRLRAAYESQDLWLCFLRIVPVFEHVATDPRYLALLQQMNLG